MDPSEAAQTVVSGQVTGRKRKAEAAHSLVEMCLTSSRRAFLSFSWAAKLLQSPKRLKRIGGVLPWGRFNCMQHSYLHQAVIGAVKASDAAVGAPASRHSREAASAVGAEPQNGSRTTPPTPEQQVEFVDLTFSDASDAGGRASPERSHTSDGSVATMRAHRCTSYRLTSALWTSAPTAAAAAAASPAFGVSEGGQSGLRAAGGGRGIPTALLVARAGTPHVSALRARRPQPKPSACVAATPTGLASNQQQLTAADMGRLLSVDSWLNDEVINYYVLLLMKREAESRHRSATTAAAAPPAPTPPAAAGAAGPNGRSPVRLASRYRSAWGGATSSLPAAAAARQPRGSHMPKGEPAAAAAAGPCAEESTQAVAVPWATGLQGATVVLATTPLPTLQLAPPCPLKQVVSAVATAAGSSGAAAAAMMAAAVATTAAGLGAVVAAGAKHLAQRRRRESGWSAGAVPEAGTSSGLAQTPSEPSSSAPSGAASPPPLGARQPHQAQRGAAAGSIYAFNSFFFSKLTERGNRQRFEYREVCRWTRPERTRTADCVLTRDLLLFPINHGNSHWCLAAVWPRRRLLQYFDSLGGARSTADWVLDTLLRWLLTDAEDKGVILGPGGAEEAFAGAAAAAGTEVAAGWRKEFSQLRIPKQLDGCSCGVFVCTFAELLARDVPPNAFGFSQADIPAIRRGMAEQILRGSL